MIVLFPEKFPRIVKSKKRLEKILNVKIELKGKSIEICGDAENEYLAEKVINALSFGFPFKEAVSIKKEEKEFEILKIKEYTKRKDLKTIRARIIGKEGKALKTLTELTNCHLELKDNSIAIIGKPEELERANEGIISLIQGAKHGNVYKFLEKSRPEEIIDFGLKEEKDKL
jgi:ribosomal RNA assembly protein